ncbi:unnamed protein product [Pelagomonas calceolata]|uniref:Uncharacterized protein n=1 Tax=Pelagomonas calceolata TaxID=35677 RepID=A0A8J2X102_9STRA|nr:unnamed protein product [Pelagomonas calceolata]
MMRPLAWLLPWAAQAVDWCPDALFTKPPPPLSLPVFLSAPATTPRSSEVAFQVSIGGSVVDAATAFSVKHAIGEDARDALVEAAHAREARGAPVARAVVITSEHADWALQRPGTLLVLVGKEMDCARAAHQSASGLAVARDGRRGAREASLIEGSVVVVATQSAPQLSLNEVLAEHERIRHARGGDGSFGVAIPDISGDSALAFPSSFYRETRPLSFTAHAVVVYHQGEDDAHKRHVFEISRAVGCAFRDHERRIHLATHNLQVFLDLATMAPLMLKRGDFLPRFSMDVAFNFEYVPNVINATEVAEASSQKTDHVQNAHGSFATAVALATLKKAARVWDYSLANVEPLSTLTRVEHVPLGWSTAWRPHRDLSRLIQDKDIPILFYGTLTSRRKRTLQMLRSNDLPIFHANAQTDGTFAPALDALILSAAIVLDLKAFDSTKTREWKMPRLAKLLAAGAFVVSEGACGVEHQCAAYAEGVVFTDDLVETLQYYMERPGAPGARGTVA